ncbi:MAG: hypothetical protein RBS96_09290 [Dehalococcoidales bacterium]|jgi:hypothetical protein|nr:hypothetical protein [Dehalococcoidales bacterium]
MKTLNEIFAIEPRLKKLEGEAIGLSGHHTSPEQFWYRYLKPKMLKLVGYGADKEELSSSEVYDTVYHHFISILGL